MGKRLHKGKVFILLSVLIIAVFIAFFGFRFVHYYIEEHPKVEGKAIVYLSDKLSEALTSSSENSGLFFDSKTKEYYFKGEVENNYLYYSGRVWRILSINENGQIRMISDKSQTILNYKNENNYLNSYINEWLNKTEIEKTGFFEDNLYKSEEYLTNSFVCTDIVDSLESITCNEKNLDNLVSLLSLYDYNRSGGVTSFINEEEFLWTSSENSSGEPWYFNNGNASTEAFKDTKYYGIKPIITLKEQIVYTSGDGTIESPYIILDENENILSERLIGEYITFSGYIWRIINKNETSVKISMEGYITSEETELLKPFSATKNKVDVSDKTSVLYYLNNTFYNSLEDKEYIVKGSFNNTSIGLETIDYKELNSSVELNIGLPSFGDMFISNYPQVYLLNNSKDSLTLVYTINENKILYGDVYKNNLKIRPSLYLDNTVLVLGNDGSMNSPYIVGR